MKLKKICTDFLILNYQNILMLIVIFILFKDNIKCNEITPEKKVEVIMTFLENKNPKFCNFIYHHREIVLYKLENISTYPEINEYLQGVSKRYNYYVFEQKLVGENLGFIHFCNNSQDYIILQLNKNQDPEKIIKILKYKYNIVYLGQR